MHIQVVPPNLLFDETALTSEQHPLPGLLMCSDTRETLQSACCLPQGDHVRGALRKTT